MRIHGSLTGHKRVATTPCDASETASETAANAQEVSVVAHDEHLVSSICEELWVAEPGKVSIFRNPDTSRPAFEAYRKLQLKKKPAPASGAPPKKS